MVSGDLTEAAVGIVVAERRFVPEVVLLKVYI